MIRWVYGKNWRASMKAMNALSVIIIAISLSGCPKTRIVTQVKYVRLPPPAVLQPEPIPRFTGTTPEHYEAYCRIQLTHWAQRCNHDKTEGINWLELANDRLAGDKQPKE